MVGIQCEEQRHDRVPRVGAPCPYQVATHFTREIPSWRHSDVERLVIARDSRGEGRVVEHADVAGESRNHERFIDCGDGAGSGGAAAVHQEFDPLAEASLVEPFVASRLVAAPQIEVEDRLELSGCRRGDELSAGVESAISNELVQSLGRQMGHESRQVWCVEQSGESLVN